MTQYEVIPVEKPRARGSLIISGITLMLGWLGNTLYRFTQHGLDGSVGIAQLGEDAAGAALAKNIARIDIPGYIGIAVLLVLGVVWISYSVRLMRFLQASGKL